MNAGGSKTLNKVMAVGDIRDDDVLEAELLRERESRESQQADHKRPTPLSE